LKHNGDKMITFPYITARDNAYKYLPDSILPDEGVAIKAITFEGEIRNVYFIMSTEYVFKDIETGDTVSNIMKWEYPKNDTHIDDFIDFGNSEDEENEDYARWIFNHFRLSANLKYTFSKFMKDYKLFCIYNNIKYRVTGASRLGDVLLTTNFNKDIGYDIRVCVNDCSKWSKE